MNKKIKKKVIYWCKIKKAFIEKKITNEGKIQINERKNKEVNKINIVRQKETLIY